MLEALNLEEEGHVSLLCIVLLQSSYKLPQKGKFNNSVFIALYQ